MIELTKKRSCRSIVKRRSDRTSVLSMVIIFFNSPLLLVNKGILFRQNTEIFDLIIFPTFPELTDSKLILHPHSQYYSFLRYNFVFCGT